MLQNAYFLAKIGGDTAENEQHFAEILPTDALRARLAAPHGLLDGGVESAALAGSSGLPSFFGDKLETARSRLHQSCFVHPDISVTAFFSIGTICMLLSRSKPNNLARGEFSETFCNIPGFLKLSLSDI